MSYREFLLQYLNAKNYLGKRLLRILLNILSTSLELPRRARLTSSRTSRQAKCRRSSFFFSFFLGHRGERDSQTPNQNLAIFFSISLILVLDITFTSLAKALKCFSNCAGKHGKRDVTTVFTYSHLNTPIDQ